MIALSKNNEAGMLCNSNLQHSNSIKMRKKVQIMSLVSCVLIITIS